MSARDFTIVFALYPELTQLDFTGPFEVFVRMPGARVRVASAAGGKLVSDSGLCFANLECLADIERCDLICAPGGGGQVAAMGDPAYMNEVRRLGAEAAYVTSVCTGSLILAAAGLIQGRRAACHWAFRDLLAAFGAIPDPARVVRDGRVISGGGVTAGIDFALMVAAEICGAEAAQEIQLAIEYAPAPPFDSGRPETAPAPVVARVRAGVEAMLARRAEAMRTAV